MDLNSPENRKLKNAIKDFEMPLDKEQLWADIQQKKSKQRFGFWLCLTGLAIGLLSGFFMFKSDISQDSTSSSNAVTEKPLVEKIPDNPRNEEAENSNQKIQINTDDIKVLNPKTSSYKNEIQNKPTEKEVIINYKNNLQKMDTASKESTLAFSTSNEVTIALENVDKEVVSKVKDVTTQLPNQIFSSNNQKVITSNSSNVNAQTQSENEGTEISTLIKKPSLADKEVAKETILKSQSQLNELPTLPANLKLSDNSFSIKEKLPLILSPNFTLTKSKPIKFTSYLTGGLGFVNSQIISRLEEPISGFPNEASIQSLETTSGSLLLRINANRKFSILTGIVYQQVNERLQYTENVERTVFLDPVLIGEIIDSEGNVQRIFGAGIGISNTRYNYTIYNKYKSVDIPLLASYDHNIGKLGLHFEAGILANIKFNFKGSTPITLDEISNGDEAFKSSLGLRYVFGLGLDYPLTNNWIFTMRPTYVFGEDDIRNIESSFKQNLDFFKVEFGIGFRL